MAQPDFGLLDTTLPYKVGGSVVKGMADVNALRAQQLQNQASEFEMRNALAEQEAYKRSASLGEAQQNLMGAGLGGKAAALSKTMAESQKLGLEGRMKQVELQYARNSQLAADPSDQNIIGSLQQQMKAGEISPEQAQQAWSQVAIMNPQQRTEYFTRMSMSAEKLLGTQQRQQQIDISRANLGVAQGHLGLARERLDQEMAGGSLSPEAIDMAANIYLKTGVPPQLGMGKQAAAARQAVFNRAAQIGMTAGVDGQPAPTAADVANTVKDAKQLIAGERSFVNKNGNVVRSQNVLVDHLDTLDSAARALANNDVRAFNAMGNKLAKETGATAPTDFDGVKKIVGDELVKAIQGGAGAVFDRKEIQESLSSANSPAQLVSMVNRYKQLAKGQLQGLEKQYESQSGKKDFKERFLTDAAKKQLSGATSPNIPQGAIDALKSGKGTREQFDQIFGTGAADKVLGKGK